jgi:hypothetical protein
MLLVLIIVGTFVPLITAGAATPDGSDDEPSWFNSEEPSSFEDLELELYQEYMAQQGGRNQLGERD